MTEPVRAPYGTWPSPVDAALVAERHGRPEWVGAVGEELWWTAPRPGEGGRRALVRLRPDGGAPEPVLPPPWNVRSRVMEYGGRPWAGLAREGEGPLIVFAHFADQRLYAFEPDAPGAGPAVPRPLTPPSRVGGGLRWCDPVVVAQAGEVWCVLEEFTGERPGDVRRMPAAVPLDGSAARDRAAVRPLDGPRHRFVTGPRLSPDGRRAAWLAWDHPRMPWEGTELKLAEVGAGLSPALSGVRTVAGGPGEAVAQAEWAPDGTLLAATDRTGWWNLHRVCADTGAAEPVGGAREEECAGPLWELGSRWFAPLADGTVAVLRGRGASRLGVLDPVSGEVADAPGPWTEWAPTLAVRGGRVTGVAAAPGRGWEVVTLDTATGRCRVVGEEHRDAVDPAYYPVPEERVFAGPGGREVHARLHPPRHPRAVGPPGAAPPYVIWAHGGPTSRSTGVLDLEIAYFTSRGLGVAQVDYGGSTGWGRAYRERLRGAWGVVDVEDCAAVARALAAEGAADPARLAIRGGSAGGWTAACSLVSPAAAGVYACAAIRYPVIDLAGWADGGTHDFESHYLEWLIGPPGEVPGLYRERSPLTHAARVAVPFLLLQGLDDAVCPPEQAARLPAAVAGRGVPHACLTFEGEGHGFRRAATIRRAVEAELALYLAVFGIEREDAPELELTGAGPDPSGGNARGGREGRGEGSAGMLEP
ncbi:prolyl oligopeptidase family serine peptidase [Streptomyces sp. DSM 44917]|uniref:Prolyl oligopeptidase family serine peptidase n=1 Tax=Streptomyces boetiae TaxID=3075541 RepID=A0ABU2L8K8_9ACTN|nr:prolyl oligopeptidase family serine peptidase [Streptomyces sp. DSM 44917]MDT0307889.1 prolyl oligopeptidase family serine peptidase [Streptomyces sp. DSM 44917]